MSVVSRRRRIASYNGRTEFERCQHESVSDYDAELGPARVGSGRAHPSEHYGLYYSLSLAVAAIQRCSKTVQRSRHLRVGIALIILTTTFALHSFYITTLNKSPLRSFGPRTLRHLEQIPLELRLFDGSEEPFRSIPQSWAPPDEGPDYGDLVIVSLAEAPPELFRRQLNATREEAYQEKRSSQMMNPNATTDEQGAECNPPSWKSDYFPNCNSFHEIDFAWSQHKTLGLDPAEYESRYLRHGGYRDAWLIESPGKESWVLKSMRLWRRFGKRDLFIVQKDALVMEKLSPSPRIVDIYGHCGTSVSVEKMDDGLEQHMVPGKGYIKQEELDAEEDLRPRNNLTDTEKLDIALAMAESLAELHGFEGGVIVHDDVQPCQWMRSKDGSLKLGDFHRAQVLGWNEKQQEYCKFVFGGGGNYRAPEEFNETECDEKIDIFSFGNNIYALLTGLWVFYDTKDWGKVQKKVIRGELPFVDDRYRTRSFVDSILVSVMEKCWRYDPAERIDIFKVVKFLRSARETYRLMDD